MKITTYTKTNSSFTLVELLIVIGILAILTAAVVIALNPADLLKQARDSNRMNDLSAIDTALAVLETQGTTDFGTANTVYVSVADSSATCANLGLPSLPSGWAYHCSASSTLQNVDGTGWIPVNFAGSTALAFSTLPVDPVNVTSSYQYYTYVPGGSWHISAILESSKYASNAVNDGGTDPTSFERGNDLTLAPFTHGMIGWWKLDGNAQDSSGFGTHGTTYGTPSYITGKQGQAQSFDGTEDYISLGTSLNAKLLNAFSIEAWYSSTQNVTDASFLGNARAGCAGGFGFQRNPYTAFQTLLVIKNGYTGYTISKGFNSGEWAHFFGVYDGSKIYYYLNGALLESKDAAHSSESSAIIIGGANSCNSGFKYDQGSVDNVRIYDHALSAAEIEAIYNREK